MSIYYYYYFFFFIYDFFPTVINEVWCNQADIAPFSYWGMEMSQIAVTPEILV